MMSTCLINRATRPSGRDGEEALGVGAFGEAAEVVDGMAGAVDLSQGPACVCGRPIDCREEVRGTTRLEHEAITSVPPGVSTPPTTPRP